MIADLWRLLQTMPQYRNKTTLLITTDHGRGDQIKKQWRDHGVQVAEASGIWLAAMGPGIAAAGEIQQPAQMYQGQVAATIAALLGLQYRPAHPVMPAIQLSSLNK